jgi:DNA-binding MarR family transcriptional regulator
MNTSKPDSDHVLHAADISPNATSELTWLLHRAAQRLRTATGEQAERQGLHLRDYIVLSAISKTPNLTQVALAKALGLDKTTLMAQLDRLEKRGLLTRRVDPHDRRARIPEITAQGDALRESVAAACAEVETAAVTNFAPGDVALMRQMLTAIIGDYHDPGSCL